LKCEHCGKELPDNLHTMYKSMGLCEECWCKNADACYEEWKMTGDVIGRW